VPKIEIRRAQTNLHQMPRNIRQRGTGIRVFQHQSLLISNSDRIGYHLHTQAVQLINHARLF